MQFTHSLKEDFELLVSNIFFLFTGYELSKIHIMF